MLSPRGVTVAVVGGTMWLCARIVGSPGLEVVAIGLLLLPFLSGGFLRWTERRITVKRSLSEGRVPPGTRVSVQLDVENRSASPASFLLLEDRLPSALGRPARLVVTGVPGRRAQRVSYTVLPQVRGRYQLGPLTVDVTDPFGLSRRRTRLGGRDELLVTPEIEDLSHPPDTASGPMVGMNRSRQLLRTGEDYFTMRGYQEGDDLRRIHWPSVARTGELMIRQNEATKRASGLVFLDDRESAIGRTHTPAFERAVSCAASVGALLLRNGFALRLSTPEVPPAAMTEDRFMDTLTSVSHSTSRSIAAAITNLRSGASSDTSLVFIGAPPAPQELPVLLRAGAAFGPKLAIVIHPIDPVTATPSQGAQLEGRATQARLAFTRAGWDCLVLTPTMRLSERWHIQRQRVLEHSV
ncbi:MAG TPA: DUF58 domain-containing protein [Actinomycetota bacterium]|nr:DUF58 domain-containing protein [Actinomycetota bacterium]